MRISAGCLTLFAIPFALGSLIAVWQAGGGFLTWYSAQSWKETPCQIISVDEIFKDEFYAVTAHFEYTWQGQRFQSSRVTVYNGEGTSASYERTLFAELSQSLDNGGRHQCFVNPDKPSRAVLYRDFQLKSILVWVVLTLPFGVIGFGIPYASWSGWRSEAAQRRLATRSPSEPWLHRVDWADRKIKPCTVAANTMGGIAIVWNGMAWPFTIVALVEAVFYDGSFWTVIPGVVLSVFGHAVFGRPAVDEIRSLWRSRGCELHLGLPTGTVGGHICGELHVPERWKPDDGLLFALTARQRATVDRSNEEEATVVVVARHQWQRRVSTVDHADGIAVVPFRFEIPDEASPTDTEDDSVDWQIEVLDGRGLIRFDVPVFHMPNRRATSCQCDTNPIRMERESLANCVERCLGTIEQQTTECLEFKFLTSIVTVDSANFSTRRRGLVFGEGAKDIDLKLSDIASIFARPTKVKDYTIVVRTKNDSEHRAICGIKRLADAKAILKSIHKFKTENEVPPQEST